jgi:hypothetical protein
MDGIEPFAGSPSLTEGIPFVGALITLKEAPRNVWIKAQVGIGGPLLGTIGAAMCYGLLMVVHFNFLLLIIFVASLSRLFSLFWKRSVSEARYFEVTAEQRWLMGALYFGLIAFLVLGMMVFEGL